MNKIAILKQGGVLAQYDTPENILSNPNSEFVASFVGTDRILKRLSLVRVGEMDLEPANGEAEDLPRISGNLTVRGRALRDHRVRHSEAVVEDDGEKRSADNRRHREALPRRGRLAWLTRRLALASRTSRPSRIRSS